MSYDETQDILSHISNNNKSIFYNIKSAENNEQITQSLQELINSIQKDPNKTIEIKIDDTTVAQATKNNINGQFNVERKQEYFDIQSKLSNHLAFSQMFSKEIISQLEI